MDSELSPCLRAGWAVRALCSLRRVVLSSLAAVWGLEQGQKGYYPVVALYLARLGSCRAESVTQSLVEAPEYIFRDPFLAPRVLPGLPRSYSW